MKRWLFAILLVLQSNFLLSQTVPKNDTAFIALRPLNTAALEEFKNNKDFQYATTEPALSLWDKFWQWVWQKIGQILSTRGGMMTFRTALIVLGILIMIFFVVKVIGTGRNGLFGRNNTGLEDYILSQDDIHQISFHDAIEQAVTAGNYRLATRLHYLQILKKLSDQGQIDWQINKTNTDYVEETTGRSFHDMFSRLTVNFEYVWYGGKAVSKEQYFYLKDEFQQFNKATL